MNSENDTNDSVSGNDRANPSEAADTAHEADSEPGNDFDFGSLQNPAPNLESGDVAPLTEIEPASAYHELGTADAVINDAIANVAFVGGELSALLKPMMGNIQHPGDTNEDFEQLFTLWERTYKMLAYFGALKLKLVTLDERRLDRRLCSPGLAKKQRWLGNPEPN